MPAKRQTADASPKAKKPNRRQGALIPPISLIKPHIPTAQYNTLSPSLGQQPPRSGLNPLAMRRKRTHHIFEPRRRGPKVIFESLGGDRAFHPLPIDHSRKRQSQLAPRVLRDFFRENDLHGNTLVEQHTAEDRACPCSSLRYGSQRGLSTANTRLYRARSAVDLNTVDDFRRAASFVSPHASMVPPCTAKRHPTQAKNVTNPGQLPTRKPLIMRQRSVTTRLKPKTEWADEDDVRAARHRRRDARAASCREDPGATA